MTLKPAEDLAVSFATSCSLRYTQAFRAVLQRHAMRFAVGGQMRFVDDPSALVRRDPERSMIPIRGIIWGTDFPKAVEKYMISIYY